MSRPTIQSKARREAAARHAPEVVHAEDAAALIGCSVKTLYRAARRGEVPHGRIGKLYVFSRVALLAWLGERAAG